MVDSVISILETTAADGKTYKTQYYKLDAIIAVGYRQTVNSSLQISAIHQTFRVVHRQLRYLYVRGLILPKPFVCESFSGMGFLDIFQTTRLWIGRRMQDR